MAKGSGHDIYGDDRQDTAKRIADAALSGREHDVVIPQSGVDGQHQGQHEKGE